jgi:hypothetical protein
MAAGACASELPERGRFIRSSTMQSALVSMVCHLVALIVLGLLTVAAQQGSSGVSLFSEMISSADVSPDWALVSGAQGDLDPGASTADGPEMLFETDVFAAAEMGSVAIDLPSAPLAAGLEGNGIGGDGLGLEGDGKGRGMFFGIVGTGKSFVYVLDCSDSMNNFERFDRACKELIYSIRKLSPEQRFYVLLYNDGAMPMDADEPVPATEQEFAKLEAWLEHAIPTGGTNPFPAVDYAISLNPDAIYLLSDGEFEPVVITLIRDKNRKSKLVPRKIPIHTIAFTSQAGENQMKIIARTSGGKYRFVK